MQLLAISFWLLARENIRAEVKKLRAMFQLVDISQTLIAKASY